MKPPESQMKRKAVVFLKTQEEARAFLDTKRSSDRLHGGNHLLGHARDAKMHENPTKVHLQVHIGHTRQLQSGRVHTREYAEYAGVSGQDRKHCLLSSALPLRSCVSLMTLNKHAHPSGTWHWHHLTLTPVPMHAFYAEYRCTCAGADQSREPGWLARGGAEICASGGSL